MLIGLTGQIGAGKSTVAAALSEMGATVIDADLIGRQVVEHSVELLAQLQAEFGESIVDQWGQLRRERLAELAFASEESKTRLNALVHPHLLKELHRRLRQALESGKIVVIDAALLLDWDLEIKPDRIWVVEASEETRMQRLTERGMSRSDVLARQKAQLDATGFRQKADCVIQNDGSLADLKQRVRRELHAINGENTG
jgi:dephospho-CoA kinase